MDVVEAIKNRKSIRCFKPDPIPKDILIEILGTSSRSPSAMNTQPWEFVVVSGDVIENIKKENIEKLSAGEVPNPEHMVVGWPSDSIYRTRQVGLAKQLFKLMDIQREDKDKRAQWLQRGFRYFDAPAAIILVTDRVLSDSGPLLDIGAVMQTICLAALNYNLGTCIEDQGVMYPEVIRKYTNLSESKRIMMSIAIGYPDENFPANRVETTRESLDNIVTWCGQD